MTLRVCVCLSSWLGCITKGGTALVLCATVWSATLRVCVCPSPWLGCITKGAVFSVGVEEENELLGLEYSALQ